MSERPVDREFKSHQPHVFLKPFSGVSEASDILTHGCTFQKNPVEMYLNPGNSYRNPASNNAHRKTPGEL